MLVALCFPAAFAAAGFVLWLRDQLKMAPTIVALPTRLVHHPEPDPETRDAMMQFPWENRADRESMQRTLDAIMAAEDTLATYLNIEAARDREDAAVAELDALWEAS